MSSGISYSGASSSPHLSSDGGGIPDGGGAMMSSSGMASTDGSNDAGAASTSSGSFGGGASGSSALASHLGDPNAVVLTKKRLQDLVKEIDPMEMLDDDVEDVLLQVPIRCCSAALMRTKKILFDLSCAVSELSGFPIHLKFVGMFLPSFLLNISPFPSPHPLYFYFFPCSTSYSSPSPSSYVHPFISLSSFPTQIADDFIENVVTSGCQMAKHRKSSTLEVKDVQLHLQRNWNMWVPGFGSEELRPYKKAPVTDAHKQRLALIKKTLKKF